MYSGLSMRGAVHLPLYSGFEIRGLRRTRARGQLDGKGRREQETHWVQGPHPGASSQAGLGTEGAIHSPGGDEGRKGSAFRNRTRRAVRKRLTVLLVIPFLRLLRIRVSDNVGLVFEPSLRDDGLQRGKKEGARSARAASHPLHSNNLPQPLLDSLQCRQ